ncbi:MAG: FHA domain-containing protein, partial [Planctomycetota bacterium]
MTAFMFELQVLLRGRVIGNSRFDQDRVRIGRSSDNDVFIDNPVFSRSHAVIQRKGIVHLLQDMNSANGTFLNGSRVTVANLNDGDRITIGKFTLVFSCAHTAPVAGVGDGAALEGGATMKLDPRARANDLERHAQSRARLVLATGEEYPLQRDVFLAGSDRICDLLVGGFWTSRLAMVARGYGGFSLVNVAGRDVLL